MKAGVTLAGVVAVFPVQFLTTAQERSIQSVEVVPALCSHCALAERLFGATARTLPEQ
jgi:hypothetical protein